MGSKTALAVIDYLYKEGRSYIQLSDLKRYLESRRGFDRLPSDRSLNSVLRGLEEEGWLYRESEGGRKWYADISKISEIGGDLVSRKIDNTLKDLKDLKRDMER